MKTFHICFSFIYFLYSNIVELHHISKIIFIRIHYQIKNTYIRDNISNRKKIYHRRNSLTDLHEAVLRNCEKNIEYAIASGIPVDLVDHAGQTALYYACQRGYIKIVEYLLRYNARHDITDLNQTSPLWIAAKEGHSHIVLILLKNGADPNRKAHDGTTALYHSSYEGHIKCVYYLIKYKANVNFAKNSGASPLFVAARNGHHRIVKHLLKYGASPIQTQEDLRSSLQTALLYNRFKCVRLLLKTNLNCLFEQTDIYGWTPLHFLAKKGSIKSARIFFHYLQKSGKEFNIYEKDLFGNTALHIAIFNKQTKFADYLIKKNFNTNQENSFGWTYNTYCKKIQEKPNINECLPKLYLSNLLSIHSIHYTSEEDLIRYEIENYVKELVLYIEKLNPLFRNSIICSGSYYEYTRVGLPNEFDYMINLNEIENLCKFVENPTDPSGYGRLYPTDTKEAYDKLFYYLEPMTQCVSSEKIRKQFYQLLTSARVHVIRKEIISNFKHLKFEWTSGDKRCGTAIHTEWYGIQYPYLSIKIDVVPCLTIYSWPKTANMKCPDEKSQFQIIARSPNISETYLWRISMSKFESIYLKSLTKQQLNGYLSLKSLRLLIPYKCKIDKLVYTDEDLITSYMFKNEFLHEIIRYPQQQQWTDTSLIHRILGILKRLHKHLTIGSIKSFYIKNYNVIDENDYKQLRLFEIKYVQILISHLKLKLETINKKSLHRNTFSVIEPIIEKPIFRNRAFSSNI
ncbi:unnamed protein product [Adineta steineri]|uniref:Ankyrin repeat protein n=1 Tax=Adineta steineri TaxID=433720 RepID=A0A818S882_9BILA|nr:unnamed protein product [Adineta steineri]CAF3667770.1 unnamed protein product [Adineta steineri]